MPGGSSPRSSRGAFRRAPWRASKPCCATCARCRGRASPRSRWSCTSYAAWPRWSRAAENALMEGWMTSVIRFLFALLLGFVLGVGGTMYMIHSGAGDFVIKRTEAVQDLERRLREVELQRDQLGRQLDDVVARSGRMEAGFAELERRFQEIQKGQEAHGAAPAGAGKE